MRSRWLLAASLGLAACAPAPGLAPIAEPPAAGSEGPRYRVFSASELAVRAIAVDSTASGLTGARLADGDLSTQWSNGGYLNPTSWVVLELEASAALSAIALKTPPSKPGSHYDVQVSEDGQAWTTALAAQTSTSWGLETKTLPAGTQGRFVRLFWRNGGSEPHFSVFEAVVHGQVSGAPAPQPTASPTPAPSATPSASPSPSPSPTAPTPTPGGNSGATASSSYAGMTPDRAIDGDYSSQWSSGGYQEREAWLTIDAGALRQLSEVTTKMRPQGGEGYFQIEVSQDGQVFEPVTGRLKNTTWGPEPRALPAGTEGRFVRLRFVNDPARPDARFSVFETVLSGGDATTSPPPSATPTAAPTAAPTVSPTATPPPAPGQAPGAPTPLRRVSLPGQAVASTGGGSLAVDGDPASVWSTWGALPQWLAVPLDAPADGPLVVSWHAASYHFTDTGYAPRHYRLEASADSTDGRNGTWQTVATHRDNPLRSRADTVDAPGVRWVRLTLDARWNVGPSLREVAVHGAPVAQRLDSWLILGDSITAQSFDPARPNSFPDLVASLTGQRPLLIGGGTGSDTAALATPRLTAALPTLPPGSFIGIALGTNDATNGVPVATFKAQLQQMITSIKQSGRTPMLARTSWSLNPNLPRYVQAIDELRAENGLQPGPDLYSHFKDHPEELRSDRVHPTAAGERSIQRLWAEAVARAYGD